MPSVGEVWIFYGTTQLPSTLQKYLKRKMILIKHTRLESQRENSVVTRRVL